MNLIDSLGPWARRLQQNKLFMGIAVPIALAFAVGTYESAGTDLAKFGVASVIAGAIKARAALGVIIGVHLTAWMAHSPDSASYNKDGTPNEQVKQIVEADKAEKPVAVVPVESPQACVDITQAVKMGQPIAVVAAPTAALRDTIVSVSANPATPTISTIASK